MRLLQPQQAVLPAPQRSPGDGEAVQAARFFSFHVAAA
jgi:hypothetical protein